MNPSLNRYFFAEWDVTEFIAECHSHDYLAREHL